MPTILLNDVTRVIGGPHPYFGTLIIEIEQPCTDWIEIIWDAQAIPSRLKVKEERGDEGEAFNPFCASCLFAQKNE